MKLNSPKSLLAILLTALLLTACFKDDLLKEIDTLRTQLADMQKRNDDLNKVLKARADSLSQALTNAQKRSDSLSNVLKTKSDSLTNALGITNANLLALTKSVDSIKVQVANISGQLTQLNSQLTTITTQLNQLNQQMGALGADFAAINAKYQELSTSLQNLTAQIAALQAEQLKLLEKLNAITLQLNPTVDITTGLVAYYPFSGNAGDSSGNGNHGTVNGATLTTDRFGKPNSAYVFNGINNYINTGQSSSLSITGDISMVAWVFDNGPSNNYHTILNKRLNSNWSYGMSYSFTYGPGGSPTEVNKIISSRKSGNSTYLDGYRYSNDTVTFNKWQCIIVTIKNNIVTFYIDGKNAGYNIYGNSFPIPMVDQPVGLTIGSSNPGEWMFGKIDDVRIYNRAITQAEITYLATH